MSLSADCRTLLVCTGYGSGPGVSRILLWDTGDGTRIREFDTQLGHEAQAASFAPDGRFVFTGGWDGARVWERATAAVCAR